MVTTHYSSYGTYSVRLTGRYPCLWALSTQLTPTFISTLRIVGPFVSLSVAILEPSKTTKSTSPPSLISSSSKMFLRIPPEFCHLLRPDLG